MEHWSSIMRNASDCCVVGNAFWLESNVIFQQLSEIRNLNNRRDRDNDCKPIQWMSHESRAKEYNKNHLTIKWGSKCKQLLKQWIVNWFSNFIQN